MLFPAEHIDLNKWAVVACDQYTSQPDYWNQVENHVGDSPSALRLVFPEVYVEDNDADDRTKAIHAAMRSYADSPEVMRTLQPGFVLVKRTLANGKKRNGLVVALDLEHYDYNAGAQTLIRTTEGTIMNRLPTRIEVRKESAMEIPHIMVLIDDPDRTVIEPLFDKGFDKLYDFDMMMNSGHIEGYHITNPDDLSEISEKLEWLMDEETFNGRYGIEGHNPFLYAMGDGNHSFAAAKVIWEELKEQAEDKEAIMNHPARYGLVELVNIHDSSLEFEPIHRVAFNVDAEDLLNAMEQHFSHAGFSAVRFDSKEKMQQHLDSIGRSGHAIPFLIGNQYGVAHIANPSQNVEAATFHAFLDTYLEQHPEVTIDYIHGDDVVDELGSKPGNMGFYLPPIEKGNFFKTLVVDSAFPRKTFSMGEADDKRFYLESRMIVE